MSDFLRRSALIGGSEVVFRLPLLFTAGWVARGVGSEAFGAWALILLYQSVLATMVSQGLPTAVSRHASGASAADAAAIGRRAFGRMSMTWLLAVLATAVLLPVATRALGLPQDTAWLLLPACAIALTAITEGLLDAFFKARELVGRQIALQAGRTLIEMLVVGGLFVANLGSLWLSTPEEWLLAYIASATALKGLLYMVLRLPAIRGDARSAPLDRERWRGMVQFGLPVAASGLVSTVAGQGDRLLVSFVIPAQDLGTYAFASMLALNMHMLGSAVFALVLPRAARAHDAGQTAVVRRLFHESQCLFLAVWIGAMSVVGLLSREIILITAGAEFIGGAIFLALLSLAWGLEQFLGVYRWLFHLVGKTGWLPYLTGLQALLILSAIAVGAATAGGLGAAFGSIAGVMAANGLQFALAMRVCPMLPSRRLVAASAASLVLIAGLVWLGSGPSAAAIRGGCTLLVLIPCTVYVLRQLGWLRARPSLES
ncbi:MAG: lipopolysaccharide biosynthesis protein [Rhodospirillaceae bacterium]